MNSSEITSQKILEIISKLNCELFEQTENECISLTYITNTLFELIMFAGTDCVLWNSEYDDRKYLNEELDDREDLEIYLRKEINKLVTLIGKIKL